MVAVAPVMRTWVDGERVRTDHFNEQIRDAINLALDPPQTVVYRTTSTNFPTGQTYIPNTWEAVSIDTNAGWSFATPTRLVINTPGTYMLDAKYQFGNYATGYRAMHLRLNAAGNPALGVLIDGDVVQPIAGAATSIRMQIPRPGLVTGDYLEMFMYQNSGAAQSTTVGLTGGYLSARWIGP